jgi:hypothetical protein
MAIDFSDFIERVRQANPIDQIIDEYGADFRLGRQRGRYRRGEVHDSLVVDVNEQTYAWFSRGERGDVYNWIQERRKCGFIDALENLAERAKMEMPSFSPEMRAARQETRKREDIFSIAQRVFERWLWADDEALSYARGRGWLDETIRQAGLGFSGRGTEKEVKDLRGELLLYEHEPESPLGVALLGYHGDIAAWGRRWEIEPQENWLEWRLIPGLIGRKRLIYPHFYQGRVRYLSGRNILGDEINREGREVKSYNLPTALAGPRQVFFNTAYGQRAPECIVVEGQGDAVTLGQWEFSAVALAGTSWRDHEDLLKALRERHGVVYVGLDNDPAGLQALIGDDREWPLTDTLGALGRVVHWPGREWGTNGQPKRKVKDANDLLQAMAYGDGLHVCPEVKENRQIEVEKVLEDQSKQVRSVLEEAPTFAEAMASWAASEKGAWRDQAMKTAIQKISELDDAAIAVIRKRLVKALNINLSEFNAMIKAARGEADKARLDSEPVQTSGGKIGDYFVEIIFNEGATSLVVRHPSGKIEVTDHLDVEGARYVARYPDTIMKKNTVLFPTKLEPLRPTGELLANIRMFIHKYLDVDVFYENLSTYYVLFSWLYDMFPVLPYLRALGDYGTGKTRLIQTIGILCYRPTFTAGATTTSPIFRLLDKYHGTLILDEADFGRSDEAVDIIKIMNTGYMKGVPVLRSVDRGQAGFDVEAYDVFGPKLLATRKKFGDRALESRCLTKEMGGGVPRLDIPIMLPKEFWIQAQHIRNLLLAYRMRYWKPEFELDYNQVDRSIEPRLNQVTLALKALVDDPKMVREIDDFIREYNAQMVVERSLTMTAKVLEAIATVGMKNQVDEGGQIFMKDVATKVNELIDEQNRRMGEEDELEGEEKGSLDKKGKVKSRKVGSIIRNYLQLRTERWTSGENKGLYYVVWDGERIRALCTRYGVEMDSLAAGVKDKAEVNILKPQQTTLDAWREERERWEAAGIQGSPVDYRSSDDITWQGDEEED